MIPRNFWHLGKYQIRVCCAFVDLVISSFFLEGLSILSSQLISLVPTPASLSHIFLSYILPACLTARIILIMTLLLPRMTLALAWGPSLPETLTYTSCNPWIGSLEQCYRPIAERNFPHLMDMVILISSSEGTSSLYPLPSFGPCGNFLFSGQPMM